jgi:hypothetical protein
LDARLDVVLPRGQLDTITIPSIFAFGREPGVASGPFDLIGRSKKVIALVIELGFSGSPKLPRLPLSQCRATAESRKRLLGLWYAML